MDSGVERVNWLEKKITMVYSLRMTTPELLAPAGCFESALAAFQYGADAVYLGLPRFSARASAVNITIEDLSKLSAYARTFPVRKKIYITLNTLLRDDELVSLVDDLVRIEPLKPDGIILQDMGLSRLLTRHFPHIPRHASTQLAVHNTAGAVALRNLGFTRIVTARELSLEENARIAREAGIEVEIFIHGALCYSYSGLCQYSGITSGRSGNRGQCAYGCREAIADGTYPFSMKDLALDDLLPRIRNLPIASLKIEGRMKSPLYVAAVTDYYRRLLDGKKADPADLQTVFSRPWTPLYADSNRENSDPIDPISIGHRGTLIGQTGPVIRDRDGSHWLRFTPNRRIERFDGLQIDLPDGGKPFGFSAATIRSNGQLVFTLDTGVPGEVRLPEDEALPFLPPGLALYCSSSQAVKRAYQIQMPRDTQFQPVHETHLTLSLAPNGLALSSSEQTVVLPASLTAAQNPEGTRIAIERVFTRMPNLLISDPDHLFASPSLLKQLRRAWFERLLDSEQEKQILTSAAVVQNLIEKLPAEPLPISKSFKIRSEQPVPSEEFDELVIVLPAQTPPQDARLALPLIVRDDEWPVLVTEIKRHIASGFTKWECTDLAGAKLLRDLGIRDLTGDWSCYALNRQAVLFWQEYGVSSTVLSAEFNSVPPSLTELVFQHVPLFISQTSPCVPLNIPYEDKRGRMLITHKIRNLYVTVDEHPLRRCSLNPSIRVDRSWSPV